MILSTRSHRPVALLTPQTVRRLCEHPGRDSIRNTAEAAAARDPDWAIREIVDDALFETAR